MPRKPLPRGRTFRTPAELLLAAEGYKLESHRIMATSLALVGVHRRLSCPRCTPFIEIPVDHDGQLMTSLAYATHELTCGQPSQEKGSP